MVAPYRPVEGMRALRAAGFAWVDPATQKLVDAAGDLLPVGVSPVSFTGTPAVGNVLSAVLAPGYTSTGFQWVRVNAATGVSTDIAGATNVNYTVQSADAGFRVGVRAVGLSYTTQDGATVPSAPVLNPGPFLSTVDIGDSITFGANAGTTANQWVQLYGVGTGGGPVNNKGISGTVLQNSNDSTGNPMANNGRDRFFADLGGINKSDGLAFNYGFNDARYTGAPSTFNVTQYGVKFREILNGCFELGYTPDKINIGALYYITDTGLNTGSTGFSGQTRAGFLAFVNEAKAVALEYNTFLADTYTAMLNNGGASLIDTDNIHPLPAGHQVIANAMLAATRPNPRTAPTLSVTSPTPGTINWTIGAVAGAQNYTIEYMAHNGTTYQFTGTVTGTSLTGQFTGLTPNYYTVRVRANFIDDTFSGWIPARVLAASNVLMSADFLGAAGTVLSAYTPEVGSGFVVQSGYTPASENVLDGNGGTYSQTNSGVYRNTTAAYGPNYYVEAVMQWYSTIAGDNVGITARAAAGANTFYFVRWNQSTNSWQLFRNSLGSNTQVGTPYADTFTSGTKTVRMTLQEQTGYLQITVSINGVDRITYQDTAPLAKGNIGIRDAFAKAAGTGVHITKLDFVQL